MGPGGMSPEAGALTRGVTEGVPLPALLLPHPGHVISQSLNRPACEMGMTIAVRRLLAPPPSGPQPPPQESGTAPVGALTPTSATHICVPWEIAPRMPAP